MIYTHLLIPGPYLVSLNSTRLTGNLKLNQDLVEYPVIQLVTSRSRSTKRLVACNPADRNSTMYQKPCESSGSSCCTTPERPLYGEEVSNRTFTLSPFLNFRISIVPTYVMPSKFPYVSAPAPGWAASSSHGTL